jgi:hypothetical protein
MTAAFWSRFDVVARVFSERLRGCEASPELRALVGSARTSWERALSQLGAEYVLPAFAAALRDLGLVGSLDPELGAFLAAVHAANVERNDEIRLEFEATVAVLNRAGIEPVLLKGAIRLVDGLYPDHGWRMLRDIDLLIAPSRLAQAIRALGDAGYIQVHSSGDELQHPSGLVQIDLHHEVFSRLLPAREVIAASRSAALGSGRVRLPSIEHQLVHLIGHGQIRHRGHACGRVAWRDRLEAAALVSWGQAIVDWQAIEARFTAIGHRRPLLSFLLALHDCALCAVPAPAGIDLLTALQRRRVALQARSVSLAHLGAFAGWCGSEVHRQLAERDAGWPRAIKNLRRLIFERGAAWKMARALGRRLRFLDA